ncbi:Gldg family protein [Paraglaciecola aquimarina]|uniref:Gldg family protein n=1 Tax=Paraglaciecola aquimarina TaxID=1235557 RepID=UPI003D17E58C
MTGQPQPAWTFYSQLQQLYAVEYLGSDTQHLPENTGVLVLIHPQNYNENLLYEIDQYALQGGKVLLFVDPHNESDQMAMMAGAMSGGNSSSLERLTAAWGIEFDTSKVLLDAMAGLDIRTQTGDVARHFGFVGFNAEQLDRDDIVTANLELINGASFGVLSKAKGSRSNWLPIIKSTVNTDLLDVVSYAQTTDPLTLSGNIKVIINHMYWLREF